MQRVGAALSYTSEGFYHHIYKNGYRAVHLFLNRICFQHMLTYTHVHRLLLSSLLYLHLSFLRQHLRQYTKCVIRGSSRSSYSSRKNWKPMVLSDHDICILFFEKKCVKRIRGNEQILFRAWRIHIHCPSWWLHTEKACLVKA